MIEKRVIPIYSTESNEAELIPRSKPVLKSRGKVLVKKFAKEFVRNGGVGVQALLSAKPMSYDSARTTSARLLKREDVQQEIMKALEATDLDYEYVLGIRKQFVDKGTSQLNGNKADNEPFVSPADVSKHLQGIENVLLRVGELAPNNSPGSKHLHLHLETEDVGEIIKQRNTSASFFNDILGTKQ